MATLASIRAKLQNKIFSTLGSQMVVTSITTSSDKWGDQVQTSSLATSVTGVPFNYFDENKTFQPFGSMSDGEFDVVLPYDTVIDVGYKVTYDSGTWDVFGVEKFPYAGGNIALLVRLKQQL